MQLHLFNRGVNFSCMVFLSLTMTATVALPATEVPTIVKQMIQNSCVDCHAGNEAEAGLDLTTLPADLSTHSEEWVRIYDRVATGEMPPKNSAVLLPEIKKQFMQDAGEWIRTSQQKQFRTTGRVASRRLTNLQLERSLQDLLNVDIPLAERMPEEQRTDGFTTVANGQPMSHFHLEQHLNVVDAALEEAFRRALSNEDEWEKEFTAQEVARRNPNQRTREPEMLDELAVTWSSKLIFYGRLPVTTANQPGWYRFTVRAKALNSPQDYGVWCTVRTGRCTSSSPLLGWVDAFEVTDEMQEFTFQAWLEPEEMLEIRPGDDTLKMGRFEGGQVGAGEGTPQNLSGVAIESLKMSRVHLGPDNKAIYKQLFGDLPVKWSKDPKGMFVTADSPKEDAAQLIEAFANKAFRKPVKKEELALYIDLVHQQLDDGKHFQTALRAGYRALLCSPRFLYLQEAPGTLDDYAVASRLSYFLWNSPPDDELLKLAAAGKLHDSKVLSSQVTRMLNLERGQHFVRDFAYQWLDLNLIDFTEPDRKLYPDFDIVVQQSMLAETHQYLQTMLDENLSVSHLIDSDFTYLNERLARYYSIDRVKGTELQKVSLHPEDHRGGLLTQGAIMKVTANGSATSPIIRGVWVSERLLGCDIPPPPKNVPAIEPDIRGAKSIREQIALHKSNDSCAVCHIKIDPPGFALENYDPSGRWRDKYIQSNQGKKSKGAVVDASLEMPNGKPFKDLDEFKQIVVSDQATLARNVAEKMLTYGTGASITFADRDAVEQIVKNSSKSGYGFQTLVYEVVVSPIFLTK